MPSGSATTSAPRSVDRYAVLGNPVAHSRSPSIHAQFAAATGQGLQYERVLCPLEGFEPALRAFAASPGARGCNVTVPFKFEAHALAPRRSARADLAQAANTLRFDAQGWWADNTDGVGLLRDITHNAGVSVRGQRVLLLGAGGACAGVLGPLIEAQPAQVVVANRSIGKAEALVQRHRPWAASHGVELGCCPLAEAGEGFDLVINGTAASLGGAGVPVPARVLRPGALAVDMMYGPAAAPFLAWAAEHGAQGRDGLGMLVEQAAESFWAWRGVRPDTAPVMWAIRHGQ